MKNLDKLYREAPQLESPETLDNHILQQARSRKPRAAVRSRSKSRINSRWWLTGYAVSYLCIFGIGFGVLLQAGFFPVGGQSGGHTVGEQSDSDNFQQESVAASDLPAAANMKIEQPAPPPLNSSSDSSAATVESEEIGESRTADSLRRSPELNSELNIESRSEPEPGSEQKSSGFVNRSAVEAAKSRAVPLTENTAEGLSADTAAATISTAEIALQPQSSANVQPVPEIRTVTWLLNQSPTLYTVQISVDDSDTDLALLAQQLAVATELVQINDSATGWFLLHGSFSERQLAEEAMDVLFVQLQSTANAGDNVVPEIVRYADLHRLAK